MGLHLVEPGRNQTEATERPKSPEERALDVQNIRLTEALQKAELRLAIEAGTARILSLALARPTDPDPEVA